MNFKDIMNKDEIYISRIYKPSPVITKPFALHFHRFYFKFITWNISSKNMA